MSDGGRGLRVCDRRHVEERATNLATLSAPSSSLLMIISPRPPRTSSRARAQWLIGRSIGEIAALLGRPAPVSGVRGKGKLGDLLERALGAEGGSAAAPDFPRLGIELKTIPLGPSGAPRESTFVCTISLASADRAEWESSVAHAKLSHVLFVPISCEVGLAPHERRIEQPLFWRPTPEQETICAPISKTRWGRSGEGTSKR